MWYRIRAERCSAQVRRQQVQQEHLKFQNTGLDGALVSCRSVLERTALSSAEVSTLANSMQHYGDKPSDNAKMGQLLDFPFTAAVWGTAAAWVGAIGTTAAFLLGSNVYRRDAKLRRYEQAVMVRVSETSVAPLRIMALNPESLTIEVHNTSAKYIYSVTGSLDRRSLLEITRGLDIFGPTRERQRPTEESRAAMLHDFRFTEEDWGFDRSIDRIGPNEVAKFTFSTPYTFQHRLSVTFTDAQNQRWEIAETRDGDLTGDPPSLTLTDKRAKNFMRFVKLSSHVLVPPNKVWIYYWDRVALRFWAIKNGRWGPGVDGWEQKIYEYASPIIKDEPGSPVDLGTLDLNYPDNLPGAQS